jgi:hypothetical protein
VEGSTTGSRGGRVRSLLRRPRVAVPAGVAAFALAVTGGFALAGSSGPSRPPDPVLGPEAVRSAKRAERREARARRGRPVRFAGAGATPRASNPDASAPSPGVQSDAEVRAELRAARAALSDFKRHLSTASLVTGAGARILGDGSAQAPDDAPGVVKRVILAANEIARFPYKWGGGHGAWRDDGYDCSGSVSFALAGAGFLDRPLTSGDFERWGDDGPGEWITIFANQGHVFMVVAGLRFDTSGRGRAGTRWQGAPRSVAGFAIRHPAGF